MGTKIGLKILAISIVLVMVVSSAVVYGYNTADVEKGTGDGAAPREGTTIIEEEAGISVYINVSDEINLTKAKEVYRTTEHETENYTIGAVALPGYPEAEDVHVYVHKEGWIVAYYLNDEPVAKIINWFEYQRPHPRDITHTKLKDAVVKMCDGVGATLNWSYKKYYDFRAPNANKMMFVTGAQRVGYERSSTFKIKLPGDLLVCERSWSHFAANSSNSSSMSIDENTINSFGPCRDGEVTKYGTLTQTQLKPEVFHTVRLEHDEGNWTTGESFSAIALLYRTGTSDNIELEECESLWSIYTAYPKGLINDTTPPVITNVTATHITNNSATIQWDTDEIANSLVKYGKASGIYTKITWNPLFVKNHPIELTGLLPGTCYYFVVNSADQSGNLAESSEFYFNTTGELNVFDTDAPANPYPSIAGTHNGTITPNKKIEVSMLYTYPCTGTGGHTEYARIWNSTLNVTAKWEGYTEDWHNISFDEPFMLIANKEYNYTIRTGSYPQIHHRATLSTANGWINCTEFLDENGREYTDGIPAIRLWA